MPKYKIHSAEDSETTSLNIILSSIFRLAQNARPKWHDEKLKIKTVNLSEI